MSDHHDHIDAWLLGQLSEKDRLAFESALKDDPELAAELEFRREMKAGLEQVEAEEVRQRIKTIAAGKPRANNSRYWWAAASVLLILSIGWWFWPGGNQPTGQELFTEYYHPKVQIDQPRTPDANPTLIDTLRQRYAGEDFAFLEQRLSRLPDSLKNRNLQMLEAVTLIELKKDAKADQVLASLMTATAPEYATEAAWLKALLHLRNDQFEPAIAILQTVVKDSATLHRKEAAVILQEIEAHHQKDQ